MTHSAFRQRLQTQYQKLGPLEKNIVQFLALYYAPITRTKLISSLNVLGCRDEDQKPWTSATLRPTLEKLLAQKLIVDERGKGLTCAPSLRELVGRETVQTGKFEALVAVITQVDPIQVSSYSNRRNFDNVGEFLREVRIGIYRHDLPFINQQYQDFRYYASSRSLPPLDDIVLEMAKNPLDLDWLSQLPTELLEFALHAELMDSLFSLKSAEEMYRFLKAEITTLGRQSEILGMLLVEQMMMRGELTQLPPLLEQLQQQKGDLDPSYFDSMQGNLACLQGRYSEAIGAYRTALAGIRKTTRKRKIFFPDVSGVLFVLALLGEGSAESLKEARGYASVGQDLFKEDAFSLLYELLDHLLRWRQGDREQSDQLRSLCSFPLGKGGSLVTFLQLCTLYWLQPEDKSALLKQAQTFYRRAEQASYHWLAAETGELIARLDEQEAESYGVFAQNWRTREQGASLLDLIKPQQDWELSLAALINLSAPPKARGEDTSNIGGKRLAWFVSYRSDDYCSLVPKEQSWSKKGEWTAGRPIALKRLTKQSTDLSYLTPQDWQICSYVEGHSYGYYNQIDYSFGTKAFIALIGHPLVFWEDIPSVRIEVIAGEPELQVKKRQDQRLQLQLQPRIKPDAKVLVRKVSPTRLQVIEVTAEHQRIATILGKNNRLDVPLSAQEQVLSAINAVASLVTVHSDIGGGLENVQELPAHSRPHLHLLPMGAGLKVALLVRPFGDLGPYFHPGKGGETVITELEGQRYQTQRNLDEEKHQAKALVKACPTLILNDETGGEWVLDDPQQCLELLLELQALQGQAQVEWPEGEKLRISHQAGFNQFRLNVHQQRDWFAAEGELHLDDKLVLGLQQLLDLLEKSPGRFVPLADGQFLALTEEFRQRLEEIKAFSEKQGQGRRFHPLAALEEVFEEAEQVKVDQHWRAHVRRIQEMKELEPKVPSTLQAELRDYQKEGFEWLARLAHWGVGACLADDMGLGKTLQALALLLTKAAQGPSLIVAPTSVCPNWASEAQRFAPTLNPIQFGGTDRASLLNNLQPFDLLICTYGLLQQEEMAEMLANVPWQVIVLDEAQAIKNVATKRSQGAMALQAEFKLITTGTPIENHLGELWNLFRFINPGLLGSLESFNERFAIPIERYQNKAARQQLKRLIQPFLLRRTKNQVLSELPARTEILLQVELSQEEIAFYEALRRQALAKLEASEAEAGAKHLQVLAEIMRLRRACCNPRLIMPDTPLTSSKLETFGEILQELLDNQHKALVFSQFVDHLAILRDYLEQQKISYQYLDGSTPLKERKKRVDAFQNGEGDVFLISLKAGGTGLNLTAADYVIHMDPWWNPAVEDQASDRAHRIGQKRPVTIYRLVAKNTIEEKIVDLHHQKRDLADSLLEGADISGKVSTEQLLQLIGGLD